jgi:hypothetical protein
VESRWPHVRPRSFHESRNPQLTRLDSYNRYIAVASRVVRRSLKEDKRVIAERRGESELRFAKWEVSDYQGSDGRRNTMRLMNGQNGKQGDVKDLNAAALQAQADAKASSS